MPNYPGLNLSTRCTHFYSGIIPKLILTTSHQSTIHENLLINREQNSWSYKESTTSCSSRDSTLKTSLALVLCTKLDSVLVSGLHSPAVETGGRF